MRLIPILLLALFAFSACNSAKTKTNTASKLTTPNTKESDKYWVDPPMLLGNFKIEELQQAPYNEWYTPIYEETYVNEERVAYFRTLLENIKIIGFVGSWCNDTKIELPNLLKILDQIDFDMERIKLIGVNENYQAPDNSNKIWKIERVPTFILIKDNKELGRFVEFPQVSLLEDMIKILEKNK